tara:strand:- start:732 stop:1088 length:357 start_codon:yes stop_codon:yes gene_type:complete
MNNTDRASIFIVCLFYVVTFSCGYFIHQTFLNEKQSQAERLILTINSDDIDSEKNSVVVYEDNGSSKPIKKIHNTSSILAISSIYEDNGYQLEYISEFLKKVTDQDVIVTRIWFSKKK